jgi:hypothetical protein
MSWHRSGVAVAEAGTLEAELIAEAGSLNAELIAVAKPLNGDPIAGADRPVNPEEFLYPSTVTGAAPLGAPVTVSWAAAGVAHTRAQAVAIDKNVKTKLFI